jgi:hypothetical protein
MKKLGFSKSNLQMTRMGISYGREGTLVTVPKDHEQTVMITGDPEWNGVWTTSKKAWGSYVDPESLGRSNLLEVVHGMFSGEITKQGFNPALKLYYPEN